MFPYDAMPVNYPNLQKPRQEQPQQDLFDGNAEQKIMGVRDILMNLQQVIELPANRFFVLTLFQPHIGALAGKPLHPLLGEFVRCARERSARRVAEKVAI